MLGAIIGGAASLFSQSQQSSDNEYYMKEQARLNKEQAKYSNELAKGMWDYTNFGNQKKHLKDAGLNPALIYGMGGQGGSAQGAGQAQGVSAPSKTPTEAGIQAQGMALQLAGLKSQIAVNESQANKNNAEAEKTKGVDTDMGKASIENIIAQTSNEKVKKGLIYADTRLKDAMEELGRSKVDETGWNVKNLMKSLDMMDKNIEATGLANELRERTMETTIKQVEETLQNTMADTIVKFSQSKVNRNEADAIVEKVKQGWSNVSIGMAGKEQGYAQLEQQAQKIANDLKLGEMGIDIQQQNVVKDYILGIGKMIVDGMGKMAGGTAIKGFR